MLFTINKFGVKDGLQASWRSHSSDMSWPPEAMLKDDRFNAWHFWVSEYFVVSESVLQFDVWNVQAFSGLFHTESISRKCRMFYLHLVSQMLCIMLILWHVVQLWVIVNDEIYIVCLSVAIYDVTNWLLVTTDTTLFDIDFIKLLWLTVSVYVQINCTSFL